MRKLPMILGLMSVLLSHATLAVDLGKRGTTFPIKEEGFVEMMMRKLKTVDLEGENKKMEQIAKDRVENPPPVKGIIAATKERSFYFDPTYTLDEDAVLPCGKILHKKGTTINPLDSMELNRRIFFIDSRERSQVEWLKDQLIECVPGQSLILENRIILIGGSVLSLKKELNQSEIYFDQLGELTTRFGIKASPAIVRQEGKQLKITEMVIDKRIAK